MKRATRELINARNKHKVIIDGTRFDTQYVANVTKIETHEVGKCYETALEGRFVDALNSGSTRNVIVSGWTVGDYNEYADGYEVTAHYWNIDEKTQKHFDLSKGERDSEYVMDIGLNVWAQHKGNFAQLKSMVPLSLIVRDGEWRTYDVRDGKEVIEDIEELTVERLFRRGL
jgi:hypothetical protein